MADSKPMVTPTVLSREFNGEVLIAELAELRLAKVSPEQLMTVVVSLRELVAAAPVAAAARMTHLSLGVPRALSVLLTRWGGRLKNQADVAHVVSHFERLAMAAAIVVTFHRASDMTRGPR